MIRIPGGPPGGELCGLNWKHVNLKKSRVTIRQSVSQLKDSVTIKGTKSGRARVLPLSRIAIEALKTQKALQDTYFGLTGYDDRYSASPSMDAQ